MLVQGPPATEPATTRTADRIASLSALPRIGVVIIVMLVIHMNYVNVETVDAPLSADDLASREGYIPVDHAQLYYRVAGRSQPVIVLHGGPDSDHRYLLPEPDRLGDSFHLIYYDQRGRGLSRAHVRPDQVSLPSEISDLDDVRAHFARNMEGGRTTADGGAAGAPRH